MFPPLWTRLTQFLVVLWVTLPFECWSQSSSQLSLKIFFFMSRSLAEVQAKAHCASSGGSVAFELPPLPLPEIHATKPRLFRNPHNCISPNPLQPLIPATQCFTKWLAPYGIACLNHLSCQFHVDIIIHCHLCLANCILPSTLSNYVSSLLCFTKFCNNYSVPESDPLPASEPLLSHLIATWGAASMGKSAMRSWLVCLWLWHQINEAPWHRSHMLKRIVTGALKLTPAESTQPKWEPVMIQHLRSLWHKLDLSNTFGIAVFAVTCVTLWCCCR